jgi:hypothetical protein
MITQIEQDRVKITHSSLSYRINKINKLSLVNSLN